MYHGTYRMGWTCRTLSLGSDLVVHPMGSQCIMVHMGWDGHVGFKSGEETGGTSHWIPVHPRWQEGILWYVPLDPSTPKVVRRDLMVHSIGSQYTQGCKKGTSHGILVHPRW